MNEGEAPTIERFRELLDLKDEELIRVQHELDDAQALLFEREHAWRAEKTLPKEQTMPVPRLEMVLTAEPDRLIWDYRLVRRRGGDVMALPLERTIILGPNRPRYHRAVGICGKLELPLRTGASFYEDMISLRLPGFAIFGDHVDDLTGYAGTSIRT